MTNKELTKIREEKKLSKSDFAKLLNITPMLLGKYEKGSIKIPDSIVEKLKDLADTATATEIEVKKTVRKAARKAKEAATATLTSDEAVATEIEAKKTVREAGRKTKDTAEKAVEAIKDSARKVIGIPNIIIQSPMGGHITLEEIAEKVPKKTADVYVRVDENKLYYVLESGETGDVDIW